MRGLHGFSPPLLIIAALFSQLPVHGEDIPERLSYGYSRVSVSTPVDTGMVEIGLGALDQTAGLDVGWEFGIAAAWDSVDPDVALFGFAAHAYATSATPVALVGSIGLLLLTDIWFLPGDTDAFQDRDQPIEGLVGIVPRIGILVPGFGSVQGEIGFSPTLAFTTYRGAVIRPEVGIALRIGRARAR